MSAQDLFDEAADRLVAGGKQIAPTRMFGSNGMKVADKTFAMFVKGFLVVKLPADRVDELIVRGVGKRFDPGHGRLMKEWVSLEPDTVDATVAYMQEAATFVEATQTTQGA